MVSKYLLLLIFFSVGEAFAHSLEDANRLYFEGKPEAALQEFQRLWDQEQSTTAAQNAVLIAGELGRFEEARRVQEAISTVELESQWITQNNASTQKRLVGMVEKSPQYTLGHYFLGKFFEESGQTDEAIAAYERVLKEDSHFVEVRPFLARLFEQKNQFDDAWRQNARVSAADSKNIKAREGMGRLAAFITKRPEEIVPPKKIPSHTRVAKVEGVERMLKIRVGIGTTSGGQPALKKSLVFRTAQPFVFWDPETNREIRSGAALSTWTIRLNATNSFAEIIDADGKPAGRFRRTLMIRQRNADPGTTIINSLAFAPNTSWGGMADKEIRGDIQVSINYVRKSLVVVNHLSIEEYLYGVLAAEMPAHWPLEALKAQAVIARTQAMYRKGLHRKFGYDICDEQHCQVYTGVTVESKKVWDAVDGTRGQYLIYNGKPAHTVFSSNCGGITQTGGQAGWGEVGYWQSIYDGDEPGAKPGSLYDLRRWLKTTPATFCQSSKYTWHPEYRWTRVVQAGDIAAKVARKKQIGKLKGIQILRRNASGRVQKVQLQGVKGNLILSKEHEIRKYLGLGSLRSTLFVVDTVLDEGMPESFIFIGGGWGHGVGFCQSGAAGRAEKGAEYGLILKEYFPGTSLVK